MRASLLASSALFAGSSLAELQTAARGAPDPTITQAPDIPYELFRKQTNDRFMGWRKEPNGWTSVACDVGGTYFQSGRYWRCCATTLDGCNVPIGCVAGSLVYSIYNSGSLSFTTLACTSAFTETELSLCNTGLMYENTADMNPATNIFCGNSPLRWTYYRVRPSEASTSDSRTSAFAPFTPNSRSAKPTETSGGAATTPRPLPDGENDNNSSSSKAWIAGAVIGPLFGLALVAFGLWFFLIRRRKKTTTPPPPSMQQQHHQQNNPLLGPYPNHNPNHHTYPIPSAYQEATQKPHVQSATGHQSWGPPAQAPLASHSPHASPYSQQQQQPYPQQWQPPQQQQPHLQPQGQYPSPSPTHSPPHSPPPQNAQAYSVIAPPRPFSAELDASNDRHALS